MATTTKRETPTQRAVREALEAYKERVREKAREVAREQGWCSQGLNEALSDLDIREVSDTVRVTALLSVTVLFDAYDYDLEAARYAARAPSNWSATLDTAGHSESVEAVTVESVEEVY